MAYIGRLAPSPTGYLHLGHAATFLVAGDRARAANGRLLLRFDDLDRQRSKAVYVDAATEDLLWLGLRSAEVHYQSRRLRYYRRAMERLLRDGFVYPCNCTRKDLQTAIQAPHEETDDEPLYSGRCRPEHIPEDHMSTGAVPSHAAQQGSLLQPGINYRFRVPDGAAVSFHDESCGPQRFIAGTDLGDFVVWRKDGLPSYQLASVVDDAAMQITEVVRGRDLLKSTARQILVQRALGLPTPAYFHTELLRDKAGQRLAKRHDALSLRTLRAAGMTPAEIRTRLQDHTHHTKAGGDSCRHVTP